MLLGIPRALDDLRPAAITNVLYNVCKQKMNRHWLIDWYEKAVQTVSVVIDRKLIYAEALLKQPEAV